MKQVFKFSESDFKSLRILKLLMGFAMISVGFECLYENYLNPLPKFQNGDKSDNSIEFVKTRKIVK